MRLLLCTLDDRSLAVRGGEWRSLLAEASSCEAVDEGARLVFPDDAGLMERLRTLIEAEVECCSWMDFWVDRVAGEIVVVVSGPDETRAALASTFAGGAGPSPAPGGR